MRDVFGGVVVVILTLAASLSRLSGAGHERERVI